MNNDGIEIVAQPVNLQHSTSCKIYLEITRDVVTKINHFGISLGYITAKTKSI